ncbi:MAG: peptidase M48 Ste24p, partial [Bacteroidota bacterium]|nr:peptidase M48 Ste24p [Bacteroidota bacterium]
MKLTARGKRPAHAVYLLFAFIPLFSLAPVFAQNSLYSFQDLSQTAYARQRDSLKGAWTCPALYTEKATQKKYRELWEARTEFITAAINDQQYLAEKEIYAYLAGILDQLQKGNTTQISQKPLLLVDRSAAVNAYATGGNLIAVNLGLLHFA